MTAIRKTKLVKRILNMFEDTNAAISVVDLIEGVSDEMNRTTVYRILKRLEDHGTLHSFIGRSGRKWYAVSKECYSENSAQVHPHFHCEKCGKTICLDTDFSIPSVSNHKVDSAQLLLVGQCEDCLT
ncbi:MAG: transcriptional repressor [Bacteroidota bacterium]